MTALTVLSACGARSELYFPSDAEPFVATDARPDAARDAIVDVIRDARSDAPVDSTPDVPVTAQCATLRVVVPPTTVLEDPGGGESFVTSRVVARTGAFDVFAPGTSRLALRARRLTVDREGGRFVFGNVGAVGEPSFTWGEGASDGERLGVCYGSDRGGEMRLWRGAYEAVGGGTIPLARTGNCYGLAHTGATWAATWRTENDSIRVVRYMRDGQPTAAFESLGAASGARVAMTGTRNGFAWAIADDNGLRVRFASEHGSLMPAHMIAPGAGTALPSIAPWPGTDAEIAVVWKRATGGQTIASVVGDGTVRDQSPFLLPSSGETGPSVVTAFRDRMVTATPSCGDFNPVEGSIVLRRFDARLAPRDEASVPARCGPTTPAASIAADGAHVLVTWFESSNSMQPRTVVRAAAFGCAD